MFCLSRATQAHLLAVLTVFSSSCGIVKGKIWDPVIGQAPACKEIHSSVRWGLAVRHKEKGTRTQKLTNTTKQTHHSLCCYRYLRTEKLNTARSTSYTKLSNQRHHNIHTMHFCTKNQNKTKIKTNKNDIILSSTFVIHKTATKENKKHPAIILSSTLLVTKQKQTNKKIKNSK